MQPSALEVWEDFIHDVPLHHVELPHAPGGGPQEIGSFQFHQVPLQLIPEGRGKMRGRNR